MPPAADFNPRLVPLHSRDSMINIVYYVGKLADNFFDQN